MSLRSEIAPTKPAHRPPKEAVFFTTHVSLILRLTVLSALLLVGLLYLFNERKFDLPAIIVFVTWLFGYALLLTRGFVRTITRPVEELARRLARIDPSRPGRSLIPLPPRHQHDEIGLIVRAINRLLQRLEQSYRSQHEAESGLAEKEGQLQRVLEGVSDAIVVLDAEMMVSRHNSAAAVLAAATRGLHIRQLLPDADEIEARLRAGTLHGMIAHGRRSLEVHARTLERGFVVVLRDITTRQAAEQNLLSSERRLKVAVQSTRSAVWELDVPHNTLWWADEYPALLGYEPGELHASHHAREQLMHPEDIDWVKTSAARYLHGEIPEYHVEYRMKRKDGGWLWISEHALVERDKEGHPLKLTGIVTDCAERKQFEEQLMYMATHDPMTGLPNRTLLNDRLDQALRHTKRTGLMVATLLIDIDRFKLINESLGHEAGDNLLRALAKRLREGLRPSDTLARLAVDEFVAICEDLPSPQEAARVAKRLLHILSQPFLIEGNQLVVSVTVGISVSPADGLAHEDVLRHADTAMQSGKASGGNCYRFFTAEMDKAARNRVTLERQISEGIERQQFVLFYQPKIDIKSGQVRGLEALIRWPHLRRGMTPPGEFIPIAEETGQIVAIGEWVLREALSQLKLWQQRGVAVVPVSVNLSSRQLMAEGVDELILRLLREHEVDPSLLDIEITESTFMSNMARVLPVLKRLREAGIGLSLDDFGTGYSSLSYLRQMPITTLKMDRSFIHEVPEKADACSIAAAIMAVGRELGITVVAEGVETPNQLEFLTRQGCHQAQGWLFHKAYPPLRAEKLLRTGE